MRNRKACATRWLPCGRRLGLALIISAVLTMSWRASAQGVSGTLNQTMGNGLSLSVDMRWVDAYGYRPVQITVAPLGPSLADRTLTVELSLRRQRVSDYDLSVRQDIEIPAGSGPVQATMSVPQHASWNMYAINVFEDGEFKKKLSTPWSSNANAGNGFREYHPAILIVGDDLPDTSKLAHLFAPMAQYDNFSPYTSSVSQIGPPVLPTAMARPLSELSARWIDYSSLDIFCLSLGQLQEMAGEHPAAFRAMLDWTAAGGNLWVYGVGADGQHTGELERLVGQGGKAEETSDPLKRGWQQPSDASRRKPALAAMADSSPPFQQVSSGNQAVTQEITNTLAQAWQSDGMPQEAHFLLREYELGMIVALAAEDPFPGTAGEWNWVLGAMGSQRWLWYQRHGVSMNRDNRDYWNFLIPDLGLAPVTEFCVMITLFVLAIGPLNYWLLRRRQRLYLLVVTTPLCAAAVTLGLFAYAVLADGLGTRVRVRSVTQLDQRQGRAACWARLSYYSGLAPGRGLTFPEDVAVLPLRQMPLVPYNDPPQRRTLIWEEGQWLSSGWLASRTPTQYLTVRSRPCDLKLELIEPQNDSGELKVKNGLGSRLAQLVVCAGDGNYYWADSVDAKATASLQPIETSEAQQRLRQTYREHRPAVPKGINNQNYGVIFGLRSRRYYYYGRNRSNTLPATQLTSRMEGTLSKLAGHRVLQLEPGSYIAVVEQSAEVVLGVPSAREEASFHVIHGKW